jgi:DNA invertase Pin-like site-specific DNA recombinase
MLTVLGGLAEFERSLIAERTGEGRARAVKAGKRLGRRPLLTGPQQAEAFRMAGEDKSHAEIGQVLRVSRSTVTRFLAKTQAGYRRYGMSGG